MQTGSLELDNPPPSQVNHARDKRKHGYYYQGDGTVNNHVGDRLAHDKLGPDSLKDPLSGALNKLNSNAFGMNVIGSSSNSFGDKISGSPFGYNLGGNQAIAAAASQAIAATQQVYLIIVLIELDHLFVNDSDYWTKLLLIHRCNKVDEQRVSKRVMRQSMLA